MTDKYKVMKHFKILFRERKNNSIHTYCFFSVPKYKDIVAGQLRVPGDTNKRYICSIKSKSLDEGVFKTEKNVALLYMIRSWLKDMGADHFYAVDTIKLPIASVKQFEQIYGTFFVEECEENPGSFYYTQQLSA